MNFLRAGYVVALDGCAGLAHLRATLRTSVRRWQMRRMRCALVGGWGNVIVDDARPARGEKPHPRVDHGK